MFHREFIYRCFDTRFTLDTLRHLLVQSIIIQQLAGFSRMECEPLSQCLLDFNEVSNSMEPNGPIYMLTPL